MLLLRLIPWLRGAVYLWAWLEVVLIWSGTAPIETKLVAQGIIAAASAAELWVAWTCKQS